MLGKKIQQTFSNIFLPFTQKTGFDMPCKLSPKGTICMECQSLLSVREKKEYIIYIVAGFALELIKLNSFVTLFGV